ncbi:MAG: hypothetical protein Q9169_007905 [Polycauliona sp. 2 TL-2023]
MDPAILVVVLISTILMILLLLTSRVREMVYWTGIVCQTLWHLASQFVLAKVNTAMGRHRNGGTTREFDETPIWKITLMLGKKKPEDHQRVYALTPNTLRAVLQFGNDTKTSVAQRLRRLMMSLGIMIRIAQSLLYWLLIAFKVAWTVLCENHNVDGYEASLSAERSLRKVVTSSEQEQQPRAECSIDRSCRITLRLAGRTLEDYKRHYTQGLEVTKVILSVHGQTVQSKQDEESDGFNPTNKMMLDRRTHSTLAQILKYLVVWIIHIGDCIGERLPTDFIMVIRGPKGEMQHVAGLDSGSSENLISRRSALASGLSIEPYEGPLLTGVGGRSIRPVGRVSFEWCVSNFDKWYTSSFAVLEDDHCQDFNIILSKEEIAKRRFYIKNCDVFFCSRRVEKPPFLNEV